MHQSLPPHIQDMINDLSESTDTLEVLNQYSRYLYGDSFLHSVYLDLGFNSETGDFDSEIPKNVIINRLLTEYSGITLPLKRSFSENSEASSEKALNNKGLKFLSARVKTILINKRITSYREVAEELIKEMSVNSKSEEKNILRRVYDALNVLLAAGVVEKIGKEYCWKSLGSIGQLSSKKENLQRLAAKYFSIKSLISRNIEKKINDEVFHFPLIFVATDEKDNKLMIESSSNSSMLRLKFKKKISIFNFEDFNIKQM